MSVRHKTQVHPHTYYMPLKECASTHKSRYLKPIYLFHIEISKYKDLNKNHILSKHEVLVARSLILNGKMTAMFIVNGPKDNK